MRYTGLIYADKELTDLVNDTHSILKLRPHEAIRVVDNSCEYINKKHNYSISFDNFKDHLFEHVNNCYLEKFKIKEVYK